MQLSVGDRLTRSGTHHHKAHGLVGRLGLGDGVDIGHKVQAADHLRGRKALKLHHIHTHGETIQLEGILKHLIGGLTRIGMLLLKHHLS